MVYIISTDLAYPTRHFLNGFVKVPCLKSAAHANLGVDGREVPWYASV